MQLTDEQQAAITLAVNDGPALACLTGGPGTGKTTVPAGLLKALPRAGVTTISASDAVQQAATPHGWRAGRSVAAKIRRRRL